MQVEDGVALRQGYLPYPLHVATLACLDEAELRLLACRFVEVSLAHYALLVFLFGDILLAIVCKQATQYGGIISSRV